MSNNFVEAFTFIGDNTKFLLDTLGTHLEISFLSIGIAIVIGVPLGIWLGHLHRFSFLAINVSNIGRALPSLGVLAILLPIVGIGRTGVIIALVLLAFPPILTNSYVAIDQVDPEIPDAAKGIGHKPLQVLLQVELPLGLPLIFAGIRTSTVFAIATATLGGIFGGGGLGEIVNDQATYGLPGVIGASYVLIVIAFASQLVFIVIEQLVTPSGLRQSRRTDRGLRAARTETISNTAETAEQAA